MGGGKRGFTTRERSHPQNLNRSKRGKFTKKKKRKTALEQGTVERDHRELSFEDLEIKKKRLGVQQKRGSKKEAKKGLDGEKVQGGSIKGSRGQIATGATRNAKRNTGRKAGGRTTKVP